MGGFMTAYMAGGRMDPPFMPTKTYPHIKGIRVPVSGADPLVTDVYQVTKDAELVSLAIACSRYDDNDHWSFYINGQQVCDSPRSTRRNCRKGCSSRSSSRSSKGTSSASSFTTCHRRPSRCGSTIKCSHKEELQCHMYRRPSLRKALSRN